MKLLRASLVAVAAAIAMIVGGMPAQAHSGHWISVYGGGYLRGQARFDGDWLQWCDRRSDGQRVRVHLRTFTGDIYTTAWAPPAGQGCYRTGHPGPSITSFRVCVEVYGCSTWHSRR